KFSSDFEGNHFSDNSGTFNNPQEGNIETLFHTHRFAQNLSYHIPIPNGFYSVYTYHYENYFGVRTSTTGPNRRVFDIYVEGQKVKEKFDMFQENNNQPITLQFPNVEVTDGILDIEMKALKNNALISGIGILDLSEGELLGSAYLRKSQGVKLELVNIKKNNSKN